MMSEHCLGQVSPLMNKKGFIQLYFQGHLGFLAHVLESIRNRFFLYSNKDPSFTRFSLDSVPSRCYSMHSLVSTSSPEPRVIKQFHPKEGAREGFEKILSMRLSQLAVFGLVLNIFLLCPVLSIEYTPNLQYLERGLRLPLFWTQ